METRIEKIKAQIAALKESGCSQAEVARQAGISAPHLSIILSGEGNPTKTTLYRIEQAVEVAWRQVRPEPSTTERLPEVLVWFRGLASSGRETVLQALGEAHKELTPPVETGDVPIDQELLKKGLKAMGGKKPARKAAS